MTRDDEIAAIERHIAERGVTRLPPAYATPTDAAPSAEEQMRRAGAVHVEMPDRRAAMRRLWRTLGARR